MEDTDLMPFGKYKEDQMINVPASYLIWLGENASKGVRIIYPKLFEYIKENMDVLKKEII